MNIDRVKAYKDDEDYDLVVPVCVEEGHDCLLILCDLLNLLNSIRQGTVHIMKTCHGVVPGTKSRGCSRHYPGGNPGGCHRVCSCLRSRYLKSWNI